MVAPKRADDAMCHRIAKTKRVADGQHGITNLYIVELAKGDGGQLLAFGLEHGEVGFRITATHRRAQPLTVGEHELDVVRTLDYMVVRQHVALTADDHPGA